MADFASYTGKFRAHKPGLHDSSAGRVVKRNRESLVCNQCRISKLRCDRAQPCGSCIKRDEAAACSYQKPIIGNESTRRVPAEDRLMHLEAMVKELMQSRASPKSMTPPVQPHDPVHSTSHADEDDNDEIRYVGSTHWSAILDDIHELKAVLGRFSKIQDMEEQGTPDPLPSGAERIFGTPEAYSIGAIVSKYLPSKVEIDRFLSIYFQGETFILPVVHTYHFQAQYREFWAEPNSANPLWLSTLFSMCYLASLARGANDTGRSPQEHAFSGRAALHEAAGQCLVLGRYHRPQQFAVEALLLYAHCKTTRSLDPSREAGALLAMVVRMAYEMGYHRDPELFGQSTVFEGEMRRRFWAVCKQMDLMISFQLGLPSNIRFENCDTKSPRNLLDSDFMPESEALPPSRSENQATNLLWFIVKDKLMPNFGRVCQDALSFKEKTPAEILELDTEIRQTYATIPRVLQAKPVSESIVDPPFLIMSRLYIEFLYLKSLCVLHRKYMARGNAFSTQSGLDAGKLLVGHFVDTYKEFSPGGQLQSEHWMLHSYTMNDFLLGVMILCLFIHCHCKRGSKHPQAHPSVAAEVLALLEQALAICVEKSAASRDARRVSQAVRLTLNGAKSLDSDAFFSQPSEASAVTPFNSQLSSGDASAVDLTALSLQTQNTQSQPEETAFGLLDPFNFTGGDLEEFDFTDLDFGNFDTS